MSRIVTPRQLEIINVAVQPKFVGRVERVYNQGLTP